MLHVKTVSYVSCVCYNRTQSVGEVGNYAVVYTVIYGGISPTLGKQAVHLWSNCGIIFATKVAVSGAQDLLFPAFLTTVLVPFFLCLRFGSC